MRMSSTPSDARFRPLTEAERRGLRRVALFGSQITMRSDFYARTFSKGGIEILSPHPREQQFIHQKYMTELVFGKVMPERRISLLDIVKQMRHSKNIDGLILGGTELSLILCDGMLREVSFLDTTSIRVNAAVTHMVAESPIIR
jgi:aspartate racemase